MNVQKITHIKVEKVRERGKVGEVPYYAVFLVGGGAITRSITKLEEAGAIVENTGKELEEFKEEVFDIINQNKSPEEILLDLKDQLTN